MSYPDRKDILKAEEIIRANLHKVREPRYSREEIVQWMKEHPDEPLPTKFTEDGWWSLVRDWIPSHELRYGGSESK